jgi:DNA-binding NarL/FixJ family response regulator
MQQTEKAAQSISNFMYRPKEKINIAIVDDHPIVIEGMQKVLMQAYSYVTAICFTTGSSFMEFIQKNPESTDIVLLDITLGDTNGIDLCKQIKTTAPSVIVLAFSNHNERSSIMRMLQNGASGYLLKNASAEELIQCIDDALNGQVALSKEAREIVARPQLSDLRTAPVITKREKEILRLIADGETSASIGEKLHLSPLTIETHRRNLMQKFEVKNVAALIREVVSQNLI